tara:strand:+ start:842 stop:1429 length:588 start_codon:yes stop_codon:yes gene_type:complete
MTSVSALHHVHKLGLFGNHQDKNEEDLLKISEIKNLFIVQIVQYKNSSILIDDLNIDNLKLKNEPLTVVSNNDTRILWNGPKNWILVSKKKDLIEELLKIFKETDFAITDLSHSRSILEIEGNMVYEVLKKGSPLDINKLKSGDSANTVYNGITITLDFISDKPNIIRIFCLRSFGESFYNSITDACLEFGYKSL